MRNSENTWKAFLELVKAGLWGNGNLDIRFEGTTDWQEVYRLATEQSVLGLVLQGIDWFKVQSSIFRRFCCYSGLVRCRCLSGGIRQ